MKTQLLKSLFFLCLVSCILCLKVNAQIVYTNIPDVTISSTTISTQTYSIDINNDSIMDFWFQTQKSSAFPCSTLASRLYAMMNSLDSTAISTTTTSSNPQKLNLNAPINSSNVWNSAGILTLRSRTFAFPPNCSPISTGNWGSNTDGYAGVRLQVNNLTYYGWIRLNVNVDLTNNSSTIIIRDYAYNSIPNQPILAGQTTITTGINETYLSGNFLIFPNPFSNSTAINFQLLKRERISLKIFDLNGRLVTTLADNNLEQGEHSIEWNAEKVNAGIYFLKMQAGEFLKTEKLIVAK